MYSTTDLKFLGRVGLRRQRDIGKWVLSNEARIHCEISVNFMVRDTQIHTMLAIVRCAPLQLWSVYYTGFADGGAVVRHPTKNTFPKTRFCILDLREFDVCKGTRAPYAMMYFQIPMSRLVSRDR